MALYERVTALVKEIGVEWANDPTLHDKVVFLEKEFNIQPKNNASLIERVAALEEEHGRLIAETDQMLVLVGVTCFITRPGTWNERVYHALWELGAGESVPSKLMWAFEELTERVVLKKLHNFEATLGMPKDEAAGPVDRLEAVERECGIIPSLDSNLMDRIEAVQKQLYV